MWVVYVEHPRRRVKFGTIYIFWLNVKRKENVLLAEKKYLFLLFI